MATTITFVGWHCKAQKTRVSNVLHTCRKLNYYLCRSSFFVWYLEPLPESRLAQFCKAPARNKAKHRTKPMLDKTRLLLEEFYKPYNKKLYEILKDQKFNWDYTWAPNRHFVFFFFYNECLVIQCSKYSWVCCVVFFKTAKYFYSSLCTS